jgi:hypothetical protein
MCYPVIHSVEEYNTMLYIPYSCANFQIQGSELIDISSCLFAGSLVCYSSDDLPFSFWHLSSRFYFLRTVWHIILPLQVSCTIYYWGHLRVIYVSNTGFTVAYCVVAFTDCCGLFLWNAVVFFKLANWKCLQSAT